MPGDAASASLTFLRARGILFMKMVNIIVNHRLGGTMARIVDNVLGLVGDTPLVRLNRIGGPGIATILAKLESQNPAGRHQGSDRRRDDRRSRAHRKAQARRYDRRADQWQHGNWAGDGRGGPQGTV